MDPKLNKQKQNITLRNFAKTKESTIFFPGRWNWQQQRDVDICLVCFVQSDK